MSEEKMEPARTRYLVEDALEQMSHENRRFRAACAAMQGLLAYPESVGSPRECAAHAVEYADALLERLKE